jgi:hypothetical protein
MRNRRALLAGAAVVVLALVAVLAVTLPWNGRGSDRHETATLTTRQTPSRADAGTSTNGLAGFNGEDPKADATGCEIGAQTFGKPMPVRLKSGQTVGLLELRVSQRCHTVWPRLSGITMQDVIVRLEAMSANGAVNQFTAITTSVNEQPPLDIFGSMATYQSIDGNGVFSRNEGGPNCAWATAQTFTRGNAGGPSVQTQPFCAT